MSAHKPLEGVKVVELASFVAAPTAGRMMAEMGADVIRVESTAGDPWRFYGANCGLPITDEENPLLTFTIWAKGYPVEHQDTGRERDFVPSFR